MQADCSRNDLGPKEGGHPSDNLKLLSRLGHRRMFAHEQVIVLIAVGKVPADVRELQDAGSGSVALTKQQVADMLGVCTKTVERTVKHLLIDGMIERIARHDANGATQGNEYRLTKAGWDKYHTIVSILRQRHS